MDNLTIITIEPTAEPDTDSALKRENMKLKQENELLRKLLASAIGTRTIVVRREIEDAPMPRFSIDENLGGDIILALAHR